MKLKWMIVIVLIYFISTGFIASRITHGYSVILIWFLFLSLWNKFIIKFLPPVVDIQNKSYVKKQTR